MAWLLSIVIRFALSRRREFLADAGSVELTKNPDAMITALRKIEGRGELEGATSAVMEMCVDNPRSGFADLFATHPPIDRRVAALVQFAGGHDPGPIALPPPDDAPDEGAEPGPRPSRRSRPSRSCPASRRPRSDDAARHRARTLGTAQPQLDRCRAVHDLRAVGKCRRAAVVNFNCVAVLPCSDASVGDWNPRTPIRRAADG